MMIIKHSKDIWRDTKEGRKSLRELKDYHLIGDCFIAEVERSKSNNSRCHNGFCRKIIGKNTLRGIQIKLNDGDVRKFNMRFVYCSDCTIELIDDEIKKLREKRYVQITRSGNSTSPSLNFKNSLLVDILAQIELEIKEIHEKSTNQIA